jgi:hypothetical protein
MEIEIFNKRDITFLIYWNGGGHEPMVDSCEHGKETFRFYKIRVWGFLDYFNNY